MALTERFQPVEEVPAPLGVLITHDSQRLAGPVQLSVPGRIADQRVGQEAQRITGLVGVLRLDAVFRRLAADPIEGLDDLGAELLVRRVRVFWLGGQDRQMTENRGAEIHQGQASAALGTTAGRTALALSGFVVASIVVFVIVVVAVLVSRDGPIESALALSPFSTPPPRRRLLLVKVESAAAPGAASRPSSLGHQRSSITRPA